MVAALRDDYAFQQRRKSAPKPTRRRSRKTAKEKAGASNADRDGIKPIKKVRFDLDMVKRFDFKAARFILNLECWLRRKYRENPGTRQWGYDSATKICNHTGLSSATLERVVKKLRLAKFIQTEPTPGERNMRQFAFADQKEYYDGRKGQQRVYASLTDIKAYREPAAIVLFNLRHWAKPNKKARKRLFKGYYWRHEWLVHLKQKKWDGFLTELQIDSALKKLKKAKAIDLIPFVDKDNREVEGKVWIALTDQPPVKDVEPENIVRPESFYDRQGNQLDTTPTSAREQGSDDKTQKQDDKAPLKNDRTESDRKRSKPIGSTGDSDVSGNPLNKAHLNTPPSFAGANSVSVEENLKPSLRASRTSARPAASPMPSASAAGSATPELCSANALSTEASVDQIQSMIQRIAQLENQCSDFERFKVIAKKKMLQDDLKEKSRISPDGWFEEEWEVIDRIPKKYRRSFRHQYQQDKEKLDAPIHQNDVNQEERNGMLRQIKSSRIPKACFGHEFGNYRRHCNDCVFEKSCEIATPAETRDAIAIAESLKKPAVDDRYLDDTPDSVPDTYFAAYREVYGMESPDDEICHADQICKNARSLKITVQLYCRIVFDCLPCLFPGKTTRDRAVASPHAFNLCGVVVKLAREEYGDSTPVNIGLIMDLKFINGQPVWRHSPTPVENFMAGWKKLCTDKRQFDFQPTYKEIMCATPPLQSLKQSDIDNLLIEAEDWLSNKENPPSLIDFLKDQFEGFEPNFESELPCPDSEAQETTADHNPGEKEIEPPEPARREAKPLTAKTPLSPKPEGRPREEQRLPYKKTQRHLEAIAANKKAQAVLDDEQFRKIKLSEGG